MFDLYEGEEYSHTDTNPLIIREGDFAGTIFRFGEFKIEENPEMDLCKISVNTEVLKPPIGLTVADIEEDPKWTSCISSIVEKILDLYCEQNTAEDSQ